MSISAHCGACDRKLLLSQLTRPSDGFRCPFCGIAFAPAYESVTPRLTGRVIGAQAALTTALAELASMTGDRLTLDRATVFEPIVEALPRIEEPDPTRGRRGHWWTRQDAARPTQPVGSATPS